MPESRPSVLLPWVEKYRPATIADVRHQTQAVSTLTRSVASARANLPHLLLYGPPGTGKTSTALALARELYGPPGSPAYTARVLELNASDERGIMVVRERINTFAAGAVATGYTTPAGHPTPPFKLIILDEADAVTADAQTALRRAMEVTSRVTRFVLICNYVSRVIPPLASRCAKFRFAPLPAAAVGGTLDMIARAEGVGLPRAARDALIDASGGDLRRAITLLQSASRGVAAGEALTPDTVAAAACTLPPGVVAGLEAAAASGQFGAVRTAVEGLVGGGYAATAVLEELGRRLSAEGIPEGGDAAKADGASSGVAAMDDLQKSAVAVKLADAERRLIDGADELIQLLDVGCCLMVVFGAGRSGASPMSILPAAT
ncbi:hypothetical protein MMPV_006904 [Pyropia vietnamensis]